MGGRLRTALGLAVALALLVPASANADLLYSQVGSGTYAQISYDFVNPSFDQNDSQGADDFTVPDGEAWHVDSIDVFGTALQGSNGTDTANVFIYGAAGALPGPAVFSQAGIQTGAAATNPSSHPEVDFTAPLISAPLLGPGTHWISVQARGPYSWAWEILNGGVHGSPAVWQNPGGGLDPACKTYTPFHSCPAMPVPASVGSDFFFRLNGSLIDSRFSLGKFKVKSKKALTLEGTFPGAGQAIVSDAAGLPATARAKAKPKKNVKRATVAVGAAGTIKLPVKLTRTATKKLGKGKKVQVRVNVAFTATGGVAYNQQANVKLVPR